MTKLIAVVDGSSYSHSVCDHAAWIAQKVGASVEVLHVLSRPDASGEPANLSGSIGLGARTALLAELAELDAQKARLAHKRGRAILDDAKLRISEAGVTDVSTLLRHGEVVETVQEFESAADLIVIGKRGEAANFNNMHLGSNLERVVRASHKPVLVASREFKPVKRFLLAFDGGKSALKAIDHIASRPVYSDLDCHLLSIGTESTSMRQQLEGAAALLRDAGFNVETDMLPGQAEHVISEQMQAREIDLLVMGAYGHSRIRNLIIGSTTTEMIRSCKAPVLLFR